MDRNKVIEASARLVATGAYDEAIKEYQRLLDLDPNDVRVLQKMGELFLKRNDIAHAAQYFTKAAESHASDGFFLKAVALYKQVLKLDPSLISVNLKLAELHEQLLLMPEAMTWFQAAASHYDKAGETHASLDALTRLDTLKKTVERERIASRITSVKRNNLTDDELRVAERTSEREPQNLALARELAEAYLSRGDPTRALARLQVCFKADSRDVDTLRLLVLAFQGLGQTARAEFISKELARVQQEKRPVIAPPPPRAAPAPLRAAAPVRPEGDAAGRVSQALQLSINLVRGVKASKSDALSWVAPQQLRRLTAGSLKPAARPEILGELLTRQGLINPLQLKRATEAKLPGERLQTALIRTGAIGERALLNFLTIQYGVPGINMDDFDVDSGVRALIPQHLWVTLCVFPVNVAGPHLIVTMADPSNLAAIDDLWFLTGRYIEPVVSTELSIRRTIERYCPVPRAFLN